MQASSGQAVVFELVDRLVRSWWTIIAGITLGIAGSLYALDQIPKVYQATTKIWIQSQMIPEDVVESTVRDEMSLRLMTFRDAVLEKPYLIELITTTFDIPADAAALEQLENRIRRSVEVTPISRGRQGFMGFALTYADTDPRRAAKVVNKLTSLYIKQNSDYRIQQAERTTTAIEAMAADAKLEVDEVDRRLIEFKRQHPFETEAHLEANVKLRESRQRELEGLLERLGEKRDELAGLKNLLASAAGDPTALSVDTPVSGLTIDPLSRRIAQLQVELDALLLDRTELHPEVRKKKRELEEALAQAANRPAFDPDGQGEEELDPATASLRAQIRNLETAIGEMGDQEAQLRRDLKEYERRIEATPEVQMELNRLQSEFGVTASNYRRLRNEAEQAEGSVDLEQGEYGTRMQALEYASIPRVPISPQPSRIIALGVAIGCVVFIVPGLLRHLLNPVISSEAGLAALSDMAVLVAIPRITTPGNRNLGRRRLAFNMSMSIICGAILATTFMMLR